MPEHLVGELVDDLIEEEVLAIGALVALGRLNDRAVDLLLDTLTVVRERTMRRLGQGDETVPVPERRLTDPHPAVASFLARLGRA